MAMLRLSLPTLAKDATDQLNATVDAAIAHASNALRDEVARVTNPPLAALNDALKKAGASVNSRVETANYATRAVRDLLNKTDTRLHNLFDTAEQALQQKITAKLYVDEAVTNGSISEVVGRFTGTGPQAQTVFKALTLGDLKALTNLVDGQLAAPEFVLDAKASSITRFSKSKSERGIEIAFLNFALKGSDVLAVDVTSKVDGLGNVYVNTAAALTKTLVTPFNGTRQTSFVDTHALVLAAAMSRDAAAGTAVLELGIGASYVDKSLQWKDIGDFLQGLVKARLISSNAPAVAGRLFSTWSQDAGGGGKIAGSLSASLRLTGPRVAALLASAAGPPARQMIIDKAIAALRLAQAVTADFDRATTVTANFAGLPNARATALVIAYAPQLNLARLKRLEVDRLMEDCDLEDREREDYAYFLGEAFVLLQLVDLIETMGAVLRARPSTGPGLPGWTPATYRAKQQTLAEDSEDWVTVMGPLRNLWSADVTPRTIAFMRTIADLAGLDATGGAVVTMTYTPQNGAPQTATVI